MDVHDGFDDVVVLERVGVVWGRQGVTQRIALADLPDDFLGQECSRKQVADVVSTSPFSEHPVSDSSGLELSGVSRWAHT